ncbi:MAG: hypothetical protein KDE63_00380 [Novosphingobium sp.]|nr:hypothetical protein [Novosphingobium sp.]
MTGPRLLGQGELASVLPPGGLSYVSSCAAESDIFASEIEAAGAALGKRRFSGVFVAGLNRCTYNAGPESGVVTFFQTPQLKKEGARSQFLPFCYNDVSQWYAANQPDAVLVMLSPPDADGNCSFGVDAGFGPDQWRDAKVRIAHINPAMPRTAGDPGIPFAELTAYYEETQPLREMPGAAGDPITDAIAPHVASLIPDGATLQTGLGKLPDTVFDNLHGHSGLRLFTGLVGDGALRLVRSGAMADGASAVFGSAIGSASLYEGLIDPHFQLRPVSVTHDLLRLAAIDRLVTINSVMSVDLFGQGFAEASSRGFMSGPGGASDFARGARASKGGLRIIALPSTAKETSRIVAPGEGIGPVSLSRFDIDAVVTEHGIADLRGLDHDQRAKAMIAIAGPDHREALAAAWADVARTI